MMDVTLDTILGYEVLQTVLGFLFLLVLIAIVAEFCQPTRSKRYRRVLADLYVAGKIKKFATEDGISLADEELDFYKYNKKQRLTDTSLDNVVEAELNEKITNSAMKSMSKKKIDKVLKETKKK